MRIAIEMKDHEIRLVQEQLTHSYNEQQMEIDDINARCAQLQQELELKNQYYQGILQDNKSTINMLQGHVDRLKEMLD